MPCVHVLQQFSEAMRGRLAASLDYVLHSWELWRISSWGLSTTMRWHANGSALPADPQNLAKSLIIKNIFHALQKLIN